MNPYYGPLEPSQWVAFSEMEFQRERQSIALTAKERGRRAATEKEFLDNTFGPAEPVKRKTVYRRES